MPVVSDNFRQTPYVTNQSQTSMDVARQQPRSDTGSPYVQRTFNPGRVLGGRNLSSIQQQMQRPVEPGTPLSAATSGSTVNWDKL